MSGLITVAIFLLTLFFNSCILILWIRIGLRYFGISSRHPVGELIYHFTDPAVNFIERLIGIKIKSIRYYDWVALGLIITMELAKVIIITSLLHGGLLPISYILVFTIGDFIIQITNLLFYLVLTRIIISWINPSWYHPILDVIKLFTEPLLIIGRRLVPAISGFDFAPFIILIILKIITLFIEASFPFRM